MKLHTSQKWNSIFYTNMNHFTKTRVVGYREQYLKRVFLHYNSKQMDDDALKRAVMLETKFPHQARMQILGGKHRSASAQLNAICDDSRVACDFCLLLPK